MPSLTALPHTLRTQEGSDKVVVTKWEHCPKGGDLPILMPPITSTDDQGLREVSFQLPLDLRLSVSKN